MALQHLNLLESDRCARRRSRERNCVQQTGHIPLPAACRRCGARQPCFTRLCEARALAEKKAAGQCWHA
eukprot:14019592-Heterocapsa_arctica.AAC.1